MNKKKRWDRRRLGFASVIFLAGGLVNLHGCRTPLFDEREWFPEQHEIDADQLREVTRFDPSEQALRTETLEEAERNRDPMAILGGGADTADRKQIELSLEECRAMALERNLELQVQLLSPTIARQSIGEEEARFESLFYSNLDWSKTDTPTSSTLSGSQMESHSANFGVSIPMRTGGAVTFDLPVNRFESNNFFSTLNPSYGSDFSISLSQPLLRGAGKRTNEYGIRIARYQTQQSEAMTKLSVIQVLTAVDRVYWRLYASRRALEVQRQEYELAVAQLEQARRLIKVGTAPKVEEIRAESGVAERLEAIIIAENTVRDRERDLKRIINQSGLGMETKTVIIPMTEPNPIHFILEPDTLAQAALEQRMEMLNLELQLVQNMEAIDFADNQKFPIVNLTYRYNVNGLGNTWNKSFDLLIDKSYEDHSLGIRIEVPLGNEAAERRYRRAILNRLQTLASQEQRRSEIRQQVYNAVDQLEANWQRVLASRASAILAARNLAAEQRQYNLGLRTSTDVLDAQTRFSQAQLSEIRALTEYEIAQVDIAFATGTMLGASKVTWVPINPE